MSTINVNASGVQSANSVGATAPMTMAKMVFLLQTLMADTAKVQLGAVLESTSRDLSLVKELSRFLTEAKAQQENARNGTGNCPWDRHASMMPLEMATFMDTLGLTYDRYGNDLANNPREWDVAIKSLETALASAMLRAGLKGAMPNIQTLGALHAAGQAAQLTEFLMEAKAQQLAAREGRGNCPWDRHASMMSPEMAAYMDKLGLTYDRYGNDLANNPREWDVAITSLENALAATMASAGLKAAGIPGAATLATLKASQEVVELAAFLAEAKAQQQAAKEGKGNCPWDKKASMMPPEMAAYMDKLGLTYDRYGNDLANNPKEWDVAITSLENALAEKAEAVQATTLKAAKLAAVCDFWLSGAAGRFMDQLV